MSPDARRTAVVLKSQIDVLDWGVALSRIAAWAARYESRYVCICNAHSCVTAGQDPDLGHVVRKVDMATPDGAPVGWMLRKRGFAGQERINCPDLIPGYREQGDKRGESVYLCGGFRQIQEILQSVLCEQFSGLKIAGAHSPPFRPLTPVEDDAVVKGINASGAMTVGVGLGCPTQTKWIAAHRGRINAMMLGVGVAFDYHAGTINCAPPRMQNAGLEWLYCLFSELRRLWKR